MSRWGVLTDGSRRGSRRQVFTTTIESGWARDVYQLRVNNVTDHVRVTSPAVPGSTPRWLEGVSVERTFGPNGRMDLVVPIGWLDGRPELYLSSSASSVGYTDGTESSGALALAPTG